MPGARKQPRKNVPKPSMKMKGAHWKKVPANKLGKSVWKQVKWDECPLDFKALERSFNAAPPPVKEKKEKKKAAETTSFVDIKRSNNINITLTALKGISFAEIKEHVTQMNEDVMTPERVQALARIMPTPEEIEQLKGFSGELEKLDKADRFLAEMMEIPRAQTRLNAWLVKMEWATRLAELNDDVAVLQRACDQVQGSKRFANVLEVALAAGNFLNSGTHRADCDGFRLDFLSKLGETRSTDGRGTLLHWVANSVDSIDQYKDSLHFYEDLSDLAEASKRNLQKAETDVNALKGKLKLVKAEVTHFPKARRATDNFKDVIQGFEITARQDISILEKDLKRLSNSWKGACAFLCEDDKFIQSEELFQLIHNFCLAWEKAAGENERLAELVAKKEEDARKKEEAKARRVEAGNIAQEALAIARQGPRRRGKATEEEGESPLAAVNEAVGHGGHFRTLRAKRKVRKPLDEACETAGLVNEFLKRDK